MIIEQIALLLHLNGLVVYTPLNLQTNEVFLDFLPANPNNIVAIYSTGGPRSNGKHGYDLMAFQIRARGNTILWPTNKLITIYNYLHGLDNTQLADGRKIINCYGLQPSPVNIGLDSNGRNNYTMNYEIEIRNVTSNRE